MDWDQVQPPQQPQQPQPSQPPRTGVPASIPGPGQVAPPPQSAQPPPPASIPGPGQARPAPPQHAQPPELQPPAPPPSGLPQGPQPPGGSVQTPLEHYRALIAARLKARTPRPRIISELTQRGVDPGQAAQLVSAVDAEIGPVAEEDNAGAGAVLLGAVGAVVAAIIGGAVWGLIAGKTQYELGIIAWGMGVLCGIGTVVAAGGRKGSNLQAVAVIGSALGIFIGKYITFYFLFRGYVADELGAEVAAQVSLLSFSTVRSFFANIGTMGSGFDILWIILAIGSAWAIPRAGVTVDAD